MALSSTSHRVALEVIEENCSSGCVPLPSHGELKDLAPVDPGGAKDTDSGAAISDKASSLEYRVHVGSSSTIDCEEQKKEQNEHALSSHESQFDKIIKAVTIAYEIQAADSNCSHPVADIENFIQSATPVIGQVPCTTSNNSCMLDQEVHNQMQNVALRSVWRWYEEPESFGIELFGKSPNDGGLLFEYFEREKPFLRPPLFTKIKQLVSGENPSGNPMFGDPKQLDSVKLSDLHPASWFCVAWYPIYQIPSALRSCQASFLTYHSIGKLVPKKCSKDVAGGLTAIICPVVGLLSLKCHGEKWFHQGEKKLGSKPTTGGSLEITDPAEHLNLRLEALKHSTSAMSKAVMPRATGEFMNYHQDYMFFSTRAF
ncbi:hypothetical protein HU200_018425 [Digitaria exilis]|uniref:Uncharacterized protein n=1 Tax=Digitaria exilis TaxID=1010633 RepID=A0A835KGC5_9POAL|nr:hypothetical protein HU200_018425 [Digitaria exilis]